jgi:hypothetical protein
MSNLGIVLDRFCERELGLCMKRYADGSVYEGDVEQATQTKASVVHDAGMSRIFKCIVLRGACNCNCNVVHLYIRKLGTLWKVFPTRHRVAAQT